MMYGDMKYSQFVILYLEFEDYVCTVCVCVSIQKHAHVHAHMCRANVYQPDKQAYTD